MDDQLKSFKLIYENTEVVNIPVKYIKYFSLIGIKENLLYIEDQLTPEKSVERARVDIDTSKLISDDYNLALKNAFLEKGGDPQKYLKELLFNRHDITHFEINGTEYGVPYEDLPISRELNVDPTNYCQENIRTGSLLDINFSEINIKE